MDLVVDVPDRAAAVLDVVDAVPPGRVVTYGDVAEALVRAGTPCGPRYVGAALARYGGGVPWWRVLRAGGLPPAHDPGTALAAYRREGTPLRADGRSVDLELARHPLP